MGSTSLHQPSIDSSSRATDPAMVASSKDQKGLRPHQDQDQDHGSTHCPRCDSTHTKFCYYNNYSLSQPRYFCKSCRRYWTKGGTLRNIPIGGICRKTKKISSTSKKFKTTTHHRQPQRNPEIDLQLLNSYPDSPIMEFSAHPRFMFESLSAGAPAAIDFLDSGGGGEFDRIGDHFPAMVAADGYGSDMGNTHGLGPEMIAYDEYDHEYYETMMNGIDVKPRVLALGWQDQLAGCHSDLHGSGEGRNGSSGYLLGFGSSWAGLMNGYGSSATKPLV